MWSIYKWTIDFRKEEQDKIVLWKDVNTRTGELIVRGKTQKKENE